MSVKKLLPKLFVLFLLLPGLTFAHTGVGETSGLMHGFGHPLGGLDHLLAMFALGLWAAQIGGRASWILPCTFVGFMLIGGVLGFSGISVPFIEEGILVSILILGILIAGAFRFPVAVCVVIAGFFCCISRARSRGRNACEHGGGVVLNRVCCGDCYAAHRGDRAGAGHAESQTACCHPFRRRRDLRVRAGHPVPWSVGIGMLD